jgi:hypothetical protein
MEDERALKELVSAAEDLAERAIRCLAARRYLEAMTLLRDAAEAAGLAQNRADQD